MGTLALVFFLAVLCDLQDLGSLTRDWTPTLVVKALSPNHWTSREFAFMYVSVCLVLIFCHHYDVSYGPVTCDFMLRYVPSIPYLLLRGLIIMMLNFIKYFFNICWDDLLGFILHFVNLVNHIDLQTLNHPCVPGINPTW